MGCPKVLPCNIPPGVRRLPAPLLDPLQTTAAQNSQRPHSESTSPRCLASPEGCAQGVTSSTRRVGWAGEGSGPAPDQERLSGQEAGGHLVKRSSRLVYVWVLKCQVTWPGSSAGMVLVHAHGRLSPMVP